MLEARNEIHCENVETMDDAIRACWQKQLSDKEQKEANKLNRKPEKKMTYLSQNERQTAIMFAAITESLQQIIDEWDSMGNRPKAIVAGLRCAKTMTTKALEWLVRDVPEEDYMRLLKDVGYYVIGVSAYEPRKRGAMSGRN